MDQKEMGFIKNTIENHLKQKGFTQKDIDMIRKNTCKLPTRKLNLVIKS